MFECVGVWGSRLQDLACIWEAAYAAAVRSAVRPQRNTETLEADEEEDGEVAVRLQEVLDHSRLGCEIRSASLVGKTSESPTPTPTPSRYPAVVSSQAWPRGRGACRPSGNT